MPGTITGNLKQTEFLKEQFALHLHHKVEVCESVKSLSIKNTHITSMVAITKAFYQHLKRVEKGSITGVASFRMNNHALATLTSMSPRSAQRHVNKLLATGFLEEKVFRGTNASYLLKINPEFLVARPHPVLTEQLIKQHIEKYPALSIPPVTYRYYHSLRPSFTDAPDGILRSSCLHTAINQDTLNNKILSKGIVDNCGKQNSKPTEKITVINNVFDRSAIAEQDNTKQEQIGIRPSAEEEQAYRQKIRRSNQNNFPAEIFSSVFFFTDLAWNFARSLLYENREFQPEQEQAAKTFIAGIFTGFARNNNPKKLAQCYNEVIVTMQIIHDYTRRKIEWQLARPEYFFDPKFSGGFHRAFNEWLPNHQKNRERNKQWNSNKKLVANSVSLLCFRSDP